MYNPGSNPFTSHAKRTGSFAESNRVIGPAPERPATSALQLSATVFPTGVTSPRPVTATRRFTLYFPILSWRYFMASPTVRSFSASSSGMSMSNSFSNAITSSTVSRLSAPRSSMKLASEVSLSRSTPSSSTMMSLTFSSSCFMSMAMINPQGGKGSDSGLHHHPAVDDQHLTRNVARQVGGEKEHRGGDVRALAESAQRNRSLKRLLDVLGQVLGQLGGDVARRHGVDQHVARGQLLRHRLRKAEQAGLGGRVVGLPFVADQPHDAGDVDDAAPAALDHPARRELGEQERGLEVRIQHLVPVLLADPEQQVVLGEAGVVDEHVDRAEVLLDRRDQPLALGRLGDVAGVAAGPVPQRGGGGLGLGAVAPAHGDLGARAGQRRRDVLPDAAAPPCYEGGLARQVDVQTPPIMRNGECGMRNCNVRSCATTLALTF